MKNIDRIVNFFLSKFLNNSTFKNNPLSYLKIFFERNTKQVDTSFTKWGNVFRNSKWSDLKIQNIKNTFFGQYLRTALFICLWSFSVHILNLNGTELDSWITFYIRGIDITYGFFFSLSLFIHNVLSKFMVSFSQSAVEAILFGESKSREDLLGDKKPLGNTVVFNENFIDYTKLDYDLQVSIDFFKMNEWLSKVINLDYLSLQTQPSQLVLTSDDLLLKLITTNKKKYYETNELLYKTDLFLIGNLNTNFLVSINEVNNFFNNNPGYSRNLLNINELATTSKQVRWETVNSLSLEGLSKSNKALNGSKQLIGSSSYNSSNTNTSMWWSNTSNLNYRPSDLSFKVSKTSKTLLKENFNFVEPSREFSIKQVNLKTLNRLLYSSESLNLESKNNLNCEDINPISPLNTENSTHSSRLGYGLLINSPSKYATNLPGNLVWGAGNNTNVSSHFIKYYNLEVINNLNLFILNSTPSTNLNTGASWPNSKALENNVRTIPHQ